MEGDCPNRRNDRFERLPHATPLPPTGSMRACVAGRSNKGYDFCSLVWSKRLTLPGDVNANERGFLENSCELFGVR